MYEIEANHPWDESAQVVKSKVFTLGKVRGRQLYVSSAPALTLSPAAPSTALEPSHQRRDGHHQMHRTVVQRSCRGDGPRTPCLPRPIPQAPDRPHRPRNGRHRALQYVAPSQPVRLPPLTILQLTVCQNEEVDWEVELCVVIGEDCKDVAEEDALDYVLGYTVANDVRLLCTLTSLLANNLTQLRTYYRLLLESTRLLRLSGAMPSRSTVSALWVPLSSPSAPSPTRTSSSSRRTSTVTSSRTARQTS